MFRWFFDRFQNFRNRIMLFFIGLVVFTVLFLGGNMYKISKDIISDQARVSMGNNLKNATLNMDNVLRTINDQTASLTLNEEVIKSIQIDVPPDNYDFFNVSQKIKKILDNTKNNNSIIKSIYLYSTSNKYFFKTDIDRTYSFVDINNTDWYKKLSIWPDNYWSSFNSKNIGTSNPENMITTIKKIKNETMTKTIGYVSLNIGYQYFQNFFNIYEVGKTGYIYIMDSNFNFIYHPDHSLLGSQLVKNIDKYDRVAKQGFFLDKEANGEMMIIYNISNYNGWIYAARIPINEVLRSVNKIRTETIILLLVCLIIAVIYSVVISINMFSPIKLLVQYMKRAGEGEDNLRIKEDRRDEFGVLFKSFNKMIIKIRNLIDELYIQQLLTKELRLKMVQSQLSPHFLYNTLDAIHWAAREKEFDEVCQMTFELSNYFRKSLSEGRECVTVHEVAEMIRSYINLQKIRFEEKMEYELSVDERVNDFKVLKYLFQPIIENAIQHSVERTAHPSLIEISWQYTEEGLLKFTVKDNGSGINSEKLLAIRNALLNENYDSTGNFALKNINLQIKLFYGQQYGLEINSEFGEGTCVNIIIPNKECD